MYKFKLIIKMFQRNINNVSTSRSDCSKYLYIQLYSLSRMERRRRVGRKNVVSKLKKYPFLLELEILCEWQRCRRGTGDKRATLSAMVVGSISIRMEYLIVSFVRSGKEASAALSYATTCYASRHYSGNWMSGGNFFNGRGREKWPHQSRTIK